MTQERSCRRRLIGSVVLCLAAGAAPLMASDQAIKAVTRPSADVTLSFTVPGKLAGVLVKAGEVVTKGQLIAQLDDRVERAQLAILKAQATDTTRIKASEAQLKQKDVDLAQTRKAFEGGAATQLQFQHAELAVSIGRLQLQLARFQHDQDLRECARAERQLERMRIHSPIDGVVMPLLAQQGESVDKLTEVVRIVNVRPLWVEAPVPTSRGKQLKLGGTCTVKFADAQDETVDGTVIHIPAEADAGSGTMMIRLEVPNKTGRRAGEHVTVHLSR